MSQSAFFAAAVDEWRQVRRDYADFLEAQYAAAEHICRGNLLNKRGRRSGIDPFTLFSGPQVRAHAYASEELIEFWRTTPRVTFTEFEDRAAGRHVCAHCGQLAAA
ncbi:hypothetical protein [Aeromicrobium sp. CTD01-1L150]|uniref:hypothetical protein n=1 Tax=Aeromicrobium sp. CTD01-1L150 TaxID=3341830 RepID=UPI0035BEE101